MVCSRITVVHRLGGRHESGRGAGPVVRTHLVILGLDPLRIEAVAPELASPVVRQVFSPAVQAEGRMGTRLVGSCGTDGGGNLVISLATASKGTMVLLAVRSPTGGAPDLGGMASSSRMTPLPAPDAQRRTGVCLGRPEGSCPPSKLDGAAHQGLGISPAD